MSNPNVIGYVVEYIQDREVTPTPPGGGPYTDLEVSSEIRVRLKLRLHNTLGKTREFVVDGPSDLADFFDTKLTPEILAASAELNAKSG